MNDCNTNATQNVTHVGVGLDTARYGHHVTFLDEQRQLATTPFDFAESHEGYEKLHRALEQLAGRHSHVYFHIRVDAAGQYAMNLERFIRALPWDKTISIGEPKRNKDYKNVHFPKRKSDCVDSHACARFAIVERPPGTLEVPVEFHQLRELASALESQTKRTTRLVNQWHNRLSRVFPELALIASRMSAAWVLRLMRKYPTPQRIAAARASSLATIPHIDAEGAEPLQTAARKTTGSMSGPLIEEVIRSLAEEIIASQRAEKRLLGLLTQGFDALPSLGQQHLLSIPGIGRQTAAALAAKIVTINRFDTPDALVSYFGTFPEENTSGVDKRGNPVPQGTLRMSAQGNDLVRGLLYMACQSAIQCNPTIRALYARQRAAGKRGDVALGHCMRKMLHLVFALWKTDQPFDPKRGQPADDAPADQQPAAESASSKTAHKKKTAQEKAAGRKGQSPSSKAVTAATSSVEDPSRRVKQPSGSCLGWIDFAQLRAQVSMEAVLEKLNLLPNLSGSGPQRRGPCPIHAEQRGRSPSHSRSFSVNLQKHAFQCFYPPCGAHGNVLDLWAAVHQLPLPQAASHLSQTFQLQFNPNREEEPVPRIPSTSPK